MSTVPKITIEHLDAAADQMSGYELMLDFVNKVIEIALAEQQESKYITAAQARELGAGNAEWLNPFTKEWRICVKDLRYLETMSKDGKNVIKYRAIKQAQPEPVDPHADLRAEYAKQVAEGTTGFYLWEYEDGGGRRHQIVGKPNFVKKIDYYYTDISCYVSKDGEPAIRMLRTEAQELQRSLGDMVEWFDPKNSKPAFKEGFKFSMDGTYTYRTKATIKLDDNMVTPEQAAAEWEAKKETHDVWIKNDVSGVWFEPKLTCRFDIAYLQNNNEYELRSKQPMIVKWADVPAGVCLINTKAEKGSVFHNPMLLTFMPKTAKADGMHTAKLMTKDGRDCQYVLLEKLKLAPADHQPCIAFQGDNIHEQINKLAMAGFALEVDGNRYRVLSLAEGYKMECAV